MTPSSLQFCSFFSYSVNSNYGIWKFQVTIVDMCTNQCCVVFQFSYQKLYQHKPKLGYDAWLCNPRYQSLQFSIQPKLLNPCNQPYVELRFDKIAYTQLGPSKRLYIITWSKPALWLVNQLWFIVPVNSWKNCMSSTSLYKSNRPQVSMVYGLKNHLGCW